MNVREIQIMLDCIDDEAELSHTWTRPAGDLNGKRRFITTLFIKQNGVKMEVPLEHFKDIPEEEPVELFKVPDKSLTQKMGAFFKKEDGISP